MPPIKGQYNLDDFMQAQRLHARQGAASASTRIFVVLLAVLFYMALISLVLLGRLDWAYLLVPLALLLVFLLYQYLYRPFLLRRTFKKHQDLSAPFEMEISEQGLSVSNPKGSALIPWTNFVKWAEGQEMILLYRSYILFQMLPKRLFASESDLQYLREQLRRNNVPQVGKTDKSVPLTRYLIYIILLVAIAVMLYLNIRSGHR